MNFDGLAEAMAEIETSAQQTSMSDVTPATEGKMVSPESMFHGRRNMTSRQWRKNLREIMDEEGLHSKARFYVYFLGTMFSSKRRLLHLAGLRKKTNGSMEAAIGFIAKRCKQTTAECSEDEFPFIHITTSNPSLAALIWKLKTKQQDRTVEKILKHSWFGHLNLDQELQRQHRMYEENLLNMMPPNVVERCNLFKDAHYMRKASDSYPLLSNSRRIAYGGASKITRAQLVQWLQS